MKRKIVVFRIFLLFKRKYRHIRLKKLKISGKLNLLGSQVTLIDLGASHFFAQRWNSLLQFSPREILLVDPDLDSLKYSKQFDPKIKFRIIDKVISRFGGKQVFYVTNVKTGSSLLKPNFEYLESDFVRKEIKEYFFPVTLKEIETLSARELVESAQDASIFMKLDVQGYELEILRGIEEFLDFGNVLLVEVETSLSRTKVMQESADFADLFSFMTLKGFAILELDPIHDQISSLDGLDSRGMILECDVVFIADSKLPKFANAKAKRGILLGYLAYGFRGLAKEMLLNDEVLRRDLLSSQLNPDQLIRALEHGVL